MLEKVAFLDYKSIIENDKMRCKQWKRILIPLVWFFAFMKFARSFSLQVQVWTIFKIHKSPNKSNIE